MCDIFTVFETAKVNGIEDPCEWLRRFRVALFKHCYEEGWTRVLYDGKNLGKKIMQWDYAEPFYGLSDDGELTFIWFSNSEKQEYSVK